MDVEEPNHSAAGASVPPSEPPSVTPGGPPVEIGVDRRRFLEYAGKGVALGLAVEAGWTSYDILKPQTSNAFGGIVAAGSVSDYSEGTVRYYIDGRFYVASAGGSLVALYQKCPHLGCRVPFCDSSGRFECPCHGSIYNIRGEYIQGPAPRGMDRFPIKVDGESVLVDTGKVVEGPARGISSVSNQAKGPSCIGGTAKGASAAPSSGLGSPGPSPSETV
jgi:cytochrome b6-f complex iron-sulfur subunit